MNYFIKHFLPVYLRTNLKERIVTIDDCLYQKYKIYRFLVKLSNSLFYLFFFRKPLIINAWVNVRFGTVIHNNWGDDINVYLLKLISKKRVIVANQSLYHSYFIRKNYICIGSILGWFENCKSIIWGSGFIDETKLVKTPPMIISSVRGECSRKRLLEQGFECPNVYGDPALLLSRFYTPKTSRKYKLGIVPHFADYDIDFLHEFVNEHPDCIVIKMKNYKRWTDIVDQIYSCEKIVSSSLHGLIVADSYECPNIWIKMSDNVAGGYFKFHDYFSSVGRIENEPVVVLSKADLQTVYDKEIKMHLCNIDFEGILKTCPFL